MARSDERWIEVQAARRMQFLVLDELHTYRRRQGSDISSFQAE
jgi:ATP-dependent helicase YprA (DUF1998 family)